MATARMLAARGWTAPQLSRAAGYVDMLAHYIDRSMAPRVSGWLNETAHWVEPPRPSHRARNVALGLIGVAMAAGMAGMAATRRRQQLADILEPAEALEFDKEYREEQLNRSYNPAGGYSSSSGHSSWGQQHSDSVVGRGSGTGHSRGVGQE